MKARAMNKLQVSKYEVTEMTDTGFWGKSSLNLSCGPDLLAGHPSTQAWHNLGWLPNALAAKQSPVQKTDTHCWSNGF